FAARRGCRVAPARDSQPQGAGVRAGASEEDSGLDPKPLPPSERSQGAVLDISCAARISWPQTGPSDDTDQSHPSRRSTLFALDHRLPAHADGGGKVADRDARLE